MAETRVKANAATDDPWGDSVVSILSVNRYSLERTFHSLEYLRGQGLVWDQSGNGRQVPRAGSPCCFVLDGNIDPGGCPEGHGIPVQPKPPERRSLACSMHCCHHCQPCVVPSAVQDAAPDRACQRILSLS